MKQKHPHSVLFIQVLICIVIVGVSLYTYIDRQNELTELKMTLPSLAKEVKNIQEENERLQYQIDRFESPLHLMELARQPEFGHLKYPSVDKVIVIPDNTAPTNTEKE